MAKYYFEKYKVSWIYDVVGGLCSVKSGSNAGACHMGGAVYTTLNFDGVWENRRAENGEIGRIYQKVIYTGVGNCSLRPNSCMYYRNGSSLVAIKNPKTVKGDLLETLIADESEYPENGISGNFWYIRKEKAFPSLKLMTANGLKNIGGGYYKDSNGVLRPIANVYYKDSQGVVRQIK